MLVTKVGDFGDNSTGGCMLTPRFVIIKEHWSLISLHYLSRSLPLHCLSITLSVTLAFTRFSETPIAFTNPPEEVDVTEPPNNEGEAVTVSQSKDIYIILVST